jgi:D-sedoheptulose 7-phosphate isomerase
MNQIKQDAQRVYHELQNAFCVYTFGNGGSCTIANHMEVDWTKNSNGFIETRSLCSNTAMIMMIANDYGYEETGAKQIEWMAFQDAVVVLVSSSGNSPNIIKTAKAAKTKGCRVIGFTGFSGGELKTLSDVSVHIDSNDYGVVEDYHSQVMHEVARMLKAQQ